jgi:2-polyprenyl-6-methoxyphenol hydroxylase-like FAD-dependent oxidoreductase
VVAADGGKSAVRKFLDIPLEGFTWKDFHIIAANIEYDLQNESDWGTASYVVDKDLWAVVAKLGKGPFWRVATSETLVAGFSTGSWDEAEGLKWMQRRLAAVLPGNTEKAKIIKISPYSMHQRCVTTFMKGNVVFAGDAAHVS